MSEYTYELASGHCSELLAFMDEQRKAKDENLCDVRFIIGNDCVYAHRAVLAVCSAYFQGLLSGAFSESHAEGGTNCRMMEIDFTGSVSNIAHLDTLLSAVYTGSLKLSSENITGVTELACFLLIERVRIVCEMFLMENLAIHTCLHYLKLAYRYDLTALFTACRRLLHSRFHDHFIYQPEMLTVAAPCLILLPKIFRFVCLRDVIQFLVHWVEGELDVGETSSNREERLTTACSILYTHRHSVRLTYCDGVSQTSLTGNGDIISRLLSHCSPWWEGLHSRSSVLDGVVRNSCLDNCSQEVQTVLPMHIAGKTANSKELHHSNAGGNSCGGIGTIHAYSQDKKIHDKEEASCIRNTDDACSMYAQSVALVVLNCTYTSYVTKFQSLFTLAKAAAMLIIIISAFTTIHSESSQENLLHFMDNVNISVGRLCLSLFAGYFSFGGWQVITVLMEEVQDPVRDVPRALVSSMFIAIVLFVLTNMAYYIVLNPQEAVQSDAIAMTFGRRLHPSLPYILATAVALCCIGSINVVVMGQPRILYAAACLGHMPRLFAMLHHKFLTPWPATFTMFVGALYMLLSGTISSLINYISLYVSIMLLVLLSALVYLRYSRPDMEEPFKVPMLILIMQVLLTAGLLAVSVYEKLHELGICLLLLASGIPVYLIFVKWSPKSKSFTRIVNKFTEFIQHLLLLELPTAYMDNNR